MKRRKFEWFLSELNDFDSPKLQLEQYSTNPQLAVDILYAVENDGRINGKYIADLGCGCGFLLLGASRIGASYCLGIDIDIDALEICRRNIEENEFENEMIDLLQLDVIRDISAVQTSFDTVLMNPPFGTKNNEGIDLKFVEAGLSLIDEGGYLYSLHKTSTRSYILRQGDKWNVIVKCIAELRWDLPATYKHHKKNFVDIATGVKEYDIYAGERSLITSKEFLAANRCLVNINEDCKRLDMDKVPILVAAPMVRYSKLPFRSLVRLYCADLAYTPMIYAKSFIASEICRNVEYTTCNGDSPTIVQFASNHPEEFATAAEFIHRYSDGIDLNCGCPKSGVTSEGYGSKLLSDPEVIADMIAVTRRRINDPHFAISVKIRLRADLRETVELCHRAQRAGVSYITVHGRTPDQRAEPADYDAIRLIKSALDIPVIANGGIKSYQQALTVAKYTNADGIMVANGLLENPAMFAGHKYTPIQCVKDWLDISLKYGCPYDLFHHQLIFMLRSVLSVPQRTIFNDLSSFPAVLDFLSEAGID
ncbi:unnamed protein product [Dracunculus medinensis]|uniref:MTS domain-containing protein n=1 Tax=Dracunculus medinensis TaxID=318479 RepID=A0A0N4U9Z6_DRAME|nr:unnamed protein product [Dracunculus medinensis]